MWWPIRRAAPRPSRTTPIRAWDAMACYPPGNATTLDCCTSHHILNFAQERRQGRLRPAAQRAVPWQHGRRRPSQSDPAPRHQGIIGLLANLFYGTGFPDLHRRAGQRRRRRRKGFVMIDARFGFRKDGPKNRLGEQGNH